MKALLAKTQATAEKFWQVMRHDIWQPLVKKPVEPHASLQPGDALSPKAIVRLRQAFPQLVPTALVQAYSNQPLGPEDPRFTGRDALLKALDNVLLEWRDGRSSLTALVGPHGCGLTSTLNQLRHRLEGDEALSFLSIAERPLSVQDALRLINSIFEFESCPATVAEMVSAINALPPRLLLIDDAHMLLSRALGNQAAVQTIGAIMVATQHRHCWIVACAKQAWRRLNFIYAVERFFSRVLHMDYFNSEELADLIGRRFYGHGFRWQPEEDMDESEWLQKRLKQLHSISGGLPEMAFFFLLRAFKVDADAVSLAPFCSLDTSVLKDCDEDELFSLAEIFVHGVLTHMEHETLFRISPDQSLLRLERLRRVGILNCIKTSEPYTSNSYYLEPILAQATVAHLVNANRLY
ncbi:ATP-binding protein [Simiduia agarivorans]|uniref:Uncharacterized protein n=1 Tax=Simiduia agarivorans (strain DSM 21679 / JCM 13881 / BCRC 17597 / SA1) TaxID=1117647 RepID=K4KL69_SIMAS|nr:ATP-binding protein [Simiduia agarivorans]AFU99904.1 hypothetical protein M5M_13830 [Simiduia agarivorans SA1 = DSM 21679]